MKYFITSVRYNWTDPTKIGFAEAIEKSVYINLADNSKWKKMTMLDFGWGKECGIYRLPALPIEQLFNLIFSYKKKNNKSLSDEDHNYFGALAYLINNYPKELLNEFFKKIEDDSLSKEQTIDLVKFLDTEYQCADNLIDRLADKNQKALIIQWKTIKSKIQNC